MFEDLMPLLCAQPRFSEVSRLYGHALFLMNMLICPPSENTEACFHQEFSEAPQSLKASTSMSELVSEALET